ncbi:glycosyltransferase family 4 protein, partial [Candidatus Saccharibacteria bacterium]|nr:glycosyltransferase family 4 protein [Candidatus Saccharibacteria bacterium]
TTHFYKRSETEIKEVKKRHKIYGDYILSVGNIEPRKNQLSLVKAMYDLPDELKEKYTLLFVGAGGWKMEQIQAEIDDAIKSGLKVQILQGRVSDEDLPAIYSGASMMGYVSHYEGFGMPIVEAMACGVPVITSNTSVMPEVAGDAGVLIDPASVDSITEAIKTIDGWSDSERQENITRGIERAAHYNWANSTASLLAAAREVK